MNFLGVFQFLRLSGSTVDIFMETATGKPLLKLTASSSEYRSGEGKKGEKTLYPFYSLSSSLEGASKQGLGSLCNQAEVEAEVVKKGNLQHSSLLASRQASR